MAQGFGKKIELWLTENEDASWVSLSVMAITAANSVGCSSLTADRWIRQLTAPESRWRLVMLKDKFGFESGWRLVRR